MANKYTHEELTKRVKTPGWRLIARENDESITDTLENLLHLTHKRSLSNRKEKKNKKKKKTKQKKKEETNKK